MSNRLILLPALLLAILAEAIAQTPLPLSVDGDAVRGQVLAFTCAGCHGISGAVNAYPNYHVPRLGGQNADYIEVALQGYRDGLRSHPTMQAQAADLSDQEIADLAAYFASRDADADIGIYTASAADMRAGEEKSAVCTACHGAVGIAESQQWPNLAGQHGSYLLESMQQYRRAERNDPTMSALMSELDDETLEQLAAFYAAKPGLFQTGQ